MDRFVDGPISETKLKHNNKTLNARRNVQNAMGRQLEQAGIGPEDLPSVVSC